MTAGQTNPQPAKDMPERALIAAAGVAVALAQEQARQAAAAAAVSVALLLQSSGSEASEPWRGNGAALSAWQLIMRSNQLAKKSRGSLR